MPKLACNGFSMFANHCRPKLEARRGRKFKGMDELIDAANPLWAKMPEDEKREWKDRAREYKRTEEYYERKRAFRRRAPRAVIGQERCVKEGEESDYDDDFDPGVPMARGLAPDDALPEPVKEFTDEFLDDKHASDLNKIRQFLSSNCEGELSDVKRCRWLTGSVQTYGPLSRMPCEITLLEWNLADGIKEEHNRIIGPWHTNLDDDAQQAAIGHAAATHKIPLRGIDEKYSEYTTNRRSVLRDLLGRSEPGIAVEQNVKVGLYKEGFKEDDGRWPIIPGDVHGRRWVVVLRSEYKAFIDAIKCLKEEENMAYDGFPASHSRIVFLETVLEALADFVRAELNGTDGMELLETLNNPSCTGPGPWDTVGSMYCSYHQDVESPFCALAQARKSVFTIFRLLKDTYALPFYE